MSDKGPTDKSIRQFNDTYDEKKRYTRREKRHRKKEKQQIKDIVADALQEELDEPALDEIERNYDNT
jgi:hypothetical protein